MKNYEVAKQIAEATISQTSEEFCATVEKTAFEHMNIPYAFQHHSPEKYKAELMKVMSPDNITVITTCAAILDCTIDVMTRTMVAKKAVDAATLYKSVFASRMAR